jgi:hypothetical protein
MEGALWGARRGSTGMDWLKPLGAAWAKSLGVRRRNPLGAARLAAGRGRLGCDWRFWASAAKPLGAAGFATGRDAGIAAGRDGLGACW